MVDFRDPVVILQDFGEFFSYGQTRDLKKLISSHLLTTVTTVLFWHTLTGLYM
jgi:hypothetical protein